MVAKIASGDRQRKKSATLDEEKSFKTQPAITCSKLTKETLEQGVKCVQS